LDPRIFSSLKIKENFANEVEIFKKYPINEDEFINKVVLLEIIINFKMDRSNDSIFSYLQTDGRYFIISANSC